jgi:uncharacterized protein YqjF (DUF2071 family)
MSLDQTGNTIRYSSSRRDRRGIPAELQATWTIGEALPRPASSSPDSLEFFLTERYCLHSENKGQLYTARIHHQPWPLQKAELVSLNSSMIESHGLPTPAGDPLLHYCDEIGVDIWPLRRV